MAKVNLDELEVKLVELQLIGTQDWAVAMPSITGDSPPALLLRELQFRRATWPPRGGEHYIPILSKYQVDEILGGRAERLRVNDYVILDQVGGGGQGDVYMARDLGVDRVCALKFLQERPDDDQRERFLNEGKALANLAEGTEGENIRENVPIIHKSEWSDTQGAFIVMEFIAGDDLHKVTDAAYQKGETLQILTVLDWCAIVANVLRVAHAKGYTHRDVKPRNIMLSTTKKIKLLDLGLAHIHGKTRTPAGHGLGTPAFMPPEQWEDAAAVSSACDIYGLGATMYYLLTGRAPFDTRTLDDLRIAHRSETPVPPSTHRPEVSGEIDELVHRMLQKVPADRGSDDDLITDLAKIRGAVAEELEVQHQWKSVNVSLKHRTKKPEIGLIACGGAISARRDSDQNMLPADRTAGEIARKVPQVYTVAGIEEINPFPPKDSTDMAVRDWETIIGIIKQNPDCSGFVITHGTDTLSYTAGAISLAFGRELHVPIVLTGAHLPLDDFGSDGLSNLQNSFRTTLAAIDAGITEVMVVFGHSALRGCRTRKRSDFEFNAFESPCFDPIATFGFDVAFSPAARRRRPIPPIEYPCTFAAGIHHLRLTPGIHPEQIAPMFTDKSVSGVILESYGTGLVPESWIPVLEHATVPVIVTRSFLSRQQQINPSSERRLRDAGAALVGDMTPEMAAVKVMWLAVQTADMSDIINRMSEDHAGEITKITSLNST